MSNENDRAKLKAEIDALRDYDPERLRRRYQELTGVSTTSQSMTRTSTSRSAKPHAPQTTRGA